MNRLKAVVERIENADRVHLFTMRSHATPLYMLGLEKPEGLKEGSRVMLCFKPSHVTVVKEPCESISMSNRILCNVAKITVGKVVCKLALNSECGELEALITRLSYERLGIKENMVLFALIKASELSIEEVMS